MKMIPVGFSLTRERDEKSFDVGSDIKIDPLALDPYARVRIEVSLMMLETGQVESYSGLVMIDYSERNPYAAAGERRSYSGASEAHKSYLRNLRDQIDKVLGDQDKEEEK